MVRDSRFLQVLDVDVEDQVAYVVREWMSGRDLTALLAGGPLSSDQAGALAREVAEALATAHHDGLTHQLLHPGSVLITPDGGVKVAGLATEAAIHGAGPGDAGEIDAAGIGRVLYAALTGRWPGIDGHGLPEALRIDGRVASPRQVRSGVPRLLDEVADRALGNAARHHAAPLRSPAEVVEALTSRVVATRSNGILAGFSQTTEGSGRPPAVLDAPERPLTSTRAVPVVRAPEPPTRGPSRAARVVGVLAAALLLAGATFVGLQLLLSAVDTGGEDEPAAAPPGSSASSPTSARANPTPLAISSATDYDPPPDGSGDENPEDTPLAIDGDPSTAWTTQNYFDPMEAQKPGVGLYVDLGAPVQVVGLDLGLVGADTGLEIRIAPEAANSPPESPDDWTAVASSASAGESASLTLDEPVTTRYVLIWFTRLPADGGDFRGGVSEVQVLG
jgi:putative peptidoglycan lipid II flippase